MVSENTVLVLGAGASQPYGFPSGPRLASEIIAEGKRGVNLSQAAHMFVELGFSDSDRRKFATELEESTMYSIDAFLQDRPEYLDLGKAMIAAQLIPREVPSCIKGDWYQYLFNRICEIRSPVKTAKLSILTFNYERSLEFFLRKAFKAKYGGAVADAERRASQIEIIYLHGNLGVLPCADSTKGRPFEPTVSASIVRDATKSLKIIHEDIDEKRFLRARELLASASRVCFLGLSYHHLNVSRLGPATTYATADAVFGTCYEMGSGERDLVTNLFARMIQLKPIKCLEMLREVPIIY